MKGTKLVEYKELHSGSSEDRGKIREWGMEVPGGVRGETFGGLLG